MKPSRLLLGLGFVVTLMTSSALASGGDSYQLRYNSTDQAAARAATLRRSDLQQSSRWNGWRRGATKVTLAPTTCPTLRPRVSDLVITGAADAWWEQGPGFPDGPSLDNRSRVFATARMANLDVRRSWPPTALRCLREQLGQSLSTSPCSPGASCTEAERLVSSERIALPHVAPVTLAFRFVVQYKLLEGRTRVGTVLVTTFVVILAKGRTEIVLNAFGGHGTVSESSVARLARILVGRIKA